MSLIGRFFDLVARTVVWAVSGRIDKFRDDYKNVEQQLASDIADVIGVPVSEIEVNFIRCHDGTFVPTVAIHRALTSFQQEAAYKVLDAISPTHQNARHVGGAN